MMQGTEVAAEADEPLSAQLGLGRLTSFRRRKADEAAVTDLDGEAEFVRLDGYATERLAEEPNVGNERGVPGHSDVGPGRGAIDDRERNDHVSPGVVPEEGGIVALAGCVYVESCLPFESTIRTTAPERVTYDVSVCGWVGSPRGTI